MPGSCNDINDLQSSPLFTKLSYGESPPSVTFQTNSRTYNMGYYFVDGIFPKWPTFMKLIQSPRGKKELQSVMLQWRLENMWSEHLGFYNPNF
jgi:hypothetical protein